MPEPYLSIVVAARNDDHGGSFLRRMQIFVSALSEQARVHGLRSELIIVEWNPPSDRPRLAQALKWPRETGPCTVRIIEVPHSIHERFRYSDRLPLFQMIAKNVGIRRARGNYILATNVDLILSDELVQFLATERLEPQCMYRIDRYGVDPDVPIDAPIRDQLEFCKKHVVYVNTRDGTFLADDLGTVRRATETSSQIPLPPRLYLLLSAYARRLGFLKVKDYRMTAPSLQLRKLRARIRPPYPRLHLTACGDFTLLAKEHWIALRGYPELELYSFHLDSMLCLMAYSAGLAETILEDPMRIYHIEHPPGLLTEWQLKEIMDREGIPMLLWPQFEAWASQMYRDKKPKILNSELWGLESEKLTETIVA